MPSDDKFEVTTRFDPATLRDRHPAAAEEAHYLVMTAGAQPGLRVEITAAAISIGRSLGQSLAYPADAALSRRHAQVVLRNGRPVVEDLGSTNGTFLDGVRLDGPRPLTEGAVLNMGSQTFRYERRGREDVKRSEELDRDLVRASHYVTALLPEPIADGPVRTDWRFVPSAKLGGDALGYFWLDDHSFAIFLIDVSGHGVGAALHSVAVLNVLRQRGLQGADWHNPPSVLAALNERFQMDDHSGMLLTAWYGVYDRTTRTLAYSGAGHHPAYLVHADRAHAEPLGVKAMMIGAAVGLAYPLRSVSVPSGSALYVFSDGAFEFTARSGVRWTIADFLPLLTAAPLEGVAESERLYRAVLETVGAAPFEDDLTILVATFS